MECTLVQLGDYLSIPEGTGSCGYLFHEIPGIRIEPFPKSVLFSQMDDCIANEIETLSGLTDHRNIIRLIGQNTDEKLIVLGKRSTDKRINGSTDQLINGWTDEGMNGWRDERMNGSTDEWISGSTDQRTTDQQITKKSWINVYYPTFFFWGGGVTSHFKLHKFVRHQKMLVK